MQNNSVFRHQCVLNIFYVLMGLIVAIPIIGSILKSGVDCDSAYYICMGERIVDGYIPYRELSLGYTPLWFYIEAASKALFRIPNGLYWPYLILFYTFQIAGTFFLYCLMCRLGIKKSFALFGAWLYLYMSHWLEGNSVLLEIPCMTFCILACWLVLKFKDNNYLHYFWIGGIAACSFLVKQYGFGTFALCLFLMLFIARCNWKKYVLFVIGYLIPIALCLVFWGDAFINKVFLNGYGTQTALEAGYEVTFADKMISIIKNLNYFCYMVCPVVYIGWAFAGISIKQHRLAHLLFAYSGILGYSVIFYFSGGLHYYQNLLPFAVVLLVELLQLTRGSKTKYVIYLLIGWILLVTTYKTYNNRVFKQYIKSCRRVEQRELARDVSRYVQKDETLFVIHNGLYHLYFTANLMPPNIETIGYSFGPMGLNEYKAGEQIREADWVIRYSYDYEYESFFTDSLKHYLEKHPVVILEDSATLLYKMH